MTESPSLELFTDGAARADGFIDFYELLGVPGDASPEMINARINEVYSRAQSNREHRHIAKRREAEALLGLMPRCMDVLMDANNRTAYDAYAIAARAGAAPTDFQSFMTSVIKESPQTRDGILELREGTPNPVASPTAATTAAASAATRAEAPSDKPAKRVVARNSLRQLNIRAAALAFVVAFVVCDLLLSFPPIVTLMISPVAALLSGLFTSRPVAPQKKSRDAQRVSA